jgi:integrase
MARAYGALTTQDGRTKVGVTEPTAISVLLCAFTMLRRASVAGANWSEVNFEDRTWAIPAGRMKSKRSFVVPLSDQALRLLQRAKELADGSSFVFPGRDEDGPIEPDVITPALGRSMKALSSPLPARMIFAEPAAP